MSASIKESLELLEGVKILAVETKKVLADGKLNLNDLPVLLGLMQNFGKLSAAVQDADQVIVEAKDLSAAEAEQLVAKILEIVAAVKAA